MVKKKEITANGRKNGGGRPEKPIDPKIVFELAKIHCTRKEIASVVGCSVDTLERRFADVLLDGDNEGKMSLKRKMHEMAFKGNERMLIWLSKQRLGYKEPKAEEEDVKPNINVIIRDIP